VFAAAAQTAAEHQQQHSHLPFAVFVVILHPLKKIACGL
jgi:hypothetical protein